MNKTIVLILICMITLTGCAIREDSIYCEKSSEKCGINLKITHACEDGCVMGHGLNYDDSPLNQSNEINDKIFRCIIMCNNKYYEGD